MVQTNDVRNEQEFAGAIDRMFVTLPFPSGGAPSMSKLLRHRSMCEYRDGRS
jgi:hypothetical protein